MRRHTLHPTSVTLIIAVGVSHAHIGLLDLALADLRFGEVIGTVRLVDCHHASECANAAPELQEGEFCSLWAFPDSYHWILAAAMPCSLRRVYRGHLGLWHLDQLSSEVIEEDRVLSLLPPIEEVSQ